MHLEIIYEDEHLVAINKPHNLAIHRSKLIRNTKEFAVDFIRNQTGRNLNPLHRLDRKTSGIMLFSDDPQTTNELSTQFENRLITKTYLAIVRGYLLGDGMIDKALVNDKGQSQEATTDYKSLVTTELAIPFGSHSTSRYSLIKLFPKTGRQHQIRKHLNHLRHPIIGDRPHGCNKQNRFFKDNWNMTDMMLHAREITFIHPRNNEVLTLKSDLSPSFIKCLDLLSFEKIDL